jgi:iron complex transport system permease protein
LFSASRLILLALLLSGILITVFILCLLCGQAPIAGGDVIKLLLKKMIFLKGETISENTGIIVFEIRLPRLILGIIVGAGLAVSGCILQGVLRNPLADPYVLGISSGASLGAAVAILLFSGRIPSQIITCPVIFFSFIGSLLTIFLVYTLAKIGGRIQIETLILSGVIVGAFFSAIIMLLMTFSGEKLHEIVSWLMGSLSLADFKKVQIVSLFIGFGVLVAFILARDLNVLSLGEEEALSLGIDSEKLKRILFLTASLITACCVCISGIIGFVGLIMPHFMRLLVGCDHRILIVASAFGGSTFLLICDTIARCAVEQTEIPVGVVCALFGAPFFIYLLRKKRKEQWQY